MSRAFFVLLKRELGAILLSPIAYVIFLCVAAITGFSFLQCAYIINSGAKGFTIIQCFFFFIPYWFCMLIIPPILTMRLFSEEYKSGSIEALLTAPVGEWDIVLSKFSAAFLFFMSLWIPTMIYFAAFQIITHNQSPFLLGPTLLSYLMLFLIGMFWISIGIFTSSLTKNQIISAISSFTVIILIFFFGFSAYMVKDVHSREIISYFFSLQHMFDFKDGLFDTRPIVYYVTGTALFLTLTQRVIAARRLKS